MSEYYEKGIKQVQVKQFKNAIDSFSKAIEAGEKVLKSLLHRSSCFFHFKKFNKAEKDLSKAIDMDPTVEEFYYNRAAAYVNMNEYGKALQDYEIATKLNPNYKNAFYNKASVHMKLDQHEAAVKNFLEAGALGHEEALIVCKHFNKRGDEINQDKEQGTGKTEKFTPKMARQLLQRMKKQSKK